MTRRKLLAEMDSAEMTDWIALYTEIEPMPEGRADLRMGVAVANGLAPHIGKGKYRPKPADFIPDWDNPEKKKKPVQSVEQMKQVWAGIQRAWDK